MGILDRVKEAAGGVAEATKKGAAQVQTKVHQSQLRSKADDAAKRLGYLIHKERTEGVAAGEEADRLVTEISELEEQIAESASAPEGATESNTQAQTDQGPSPEGASGAQGTEPPSGS